MARELLVEAILHKGEDLNSAYAEGLNTVVGELLKKWAGGEKCPEPDVRVLNVHLHDKDDELIGFRYYLVTGEGMTFGKPSVEVLE